MTSTASPRRLPSTVSTVSTGRRLDATPGCGSGDVGPRALDHVTADLRAEPRPPALLSHTGRRLARLSPRALGPTAPEAA
jgi:hypothetical protein